MRSGQIGAAKTKHNTAHRHPFSRGHRARAPAPVTQSNPQPKTYKCCPVPRYINPRAPGRIGIAVTTAPRTIQQALKSSAGFINSSRTSYISNRISLLRVMVGYWALSKPNRNNHLRCAYGREFLSLGVHATLKGFRLSEEIRTRQIRSSKQPTGRRRSFPFRRQPLSCPSRTCSTAQLSTAAANKKSTLWGAFFISGGRLRQG